MKKLFLLLAICFSSSAFGQEYYFEWAKSMGSEGDDFGTSMAIDESGNVYSTGFFSGSVDFDPGIGEFNLSSNGGTDIFILKLDENGNFLWAKSIGGTDDDKGNSIVCDVFGNIYIIGHFYGTVDFDPGAGVFNLTSSGGSDIYIQKLGSDGNFIWVKTIGGTGDDSGISVNLDTLGNIYSTGYYAGIVDFDPGASVFNLPIYHLPTWRHAFIQKLDVDGNFLWARSISGTNYIYPSTITIDGGGNVYSTGKFNYSYDFDPGSNIYELYSAEEDTYIQKLDSDGSFIWAKKLGFQHNEESQSITVDDLGNVYTTGTFQGTIDFDPGPDDFYLSSSISDFSFGGYDIFIQKLDEDGNFLWAKSMGDSTGYDIGNSIICDSSNNIYSTGYFYGTVDFDPGVGVFNLTSSGSSDIYIQKLDAFGNFLWAKSLGGANSESGESIIIDEIGNLHLIGSFQDTVDFNPGVNVFNLNSVGGADIYLQKMVFCTLLDEWTDSIVACDSYTWIDGVTYTAHNNTATQILSDVTGNGCNLVTLNLTINNSNTGSESITECDSYTWTTNGQTYTESGQYTEVLTNQSGCDSTVTLDLTINSSSSSTQTQTGIDSYTWSVNNETYTESGTYTAVIPNVVGCDSTITLDLTLEFVGLDENESSYVAVYPNPTYHSFTLSTKDMINMNYTLLDIQGKVVLTGKIESSEEKVNISNLSMGQYNLVFEDESISPISIIKN